MECQHHGETMDLNNLATSELARKTQVYWAVSNVFNTGKGISLTTTKAIHTCVDAISNLGPHRVLRNKIFALQEHIIQGRKKKKSNQPLENVILMKAVP